MSMDQGTADAFANSWNHLPVGSIYTRSQFEDWMAPITATDVKGKRILELGCGNGSQLVHLAEWLPEFMEGVDLGDSVLSASENLSRINFENWKITKADMTEFCGSGYDFVYSIGVLHHLKDPKKGFDAVVENVKEGGRFHCWVYAEEGNALIIHIVEPLRKIASRLPWWFTKYLISIPLVLPYFFYAKALRYCSKWSVAKKMPLYEYSLWISEREFKFFRHVAFDQLVTPQTCYISREVIEGWISANEAVDADSVYIVMRNGNSWKFGGRVKEEG